MKHLLTAALIATALASPVSAETLFGVFAEVILAEGEVLSSTTHVLDAGAGSVIHYLLLRHRDADSGEYKIYGCEYIFLRGEPSLSCIRDE